MSSCKICLSTSYILLPSLSWKLAVSVLLMLEFREKRCCTPSAVGTTIGLSSATSIPLHLN